MAAIQQHFRIDEDGELDAEWDPIIPFADGKIQVAIVILALGIFVFSMQSILTSAAIELTGESVSSSATSLIYAASFLGSLAPTVSGVLTDAYGLKSAFYFGAFFGRCQLAMLTCLPRAMLNASGGVLFVIVELAPTVPPRPIVTGATSTLLLPMCTSSSITVRCLAAPS